MSESERRILTFLVRWGIMKKILRGGGWKMPGVPEITSVKEYHVHLENTIIRMLIDVPWEMEKNAALPPPTPHSHVCSELFVCGAGEIVLKTENGYLTLHSGDAAIVPPGVYHVKYRTAPDTTGHAISFQCIRKNTRDCTDLYRQFLPYISGRQILVYRQHPTLFADVQSILQTAETEKGFRPALLLAELLLRNTTVPPEQENSREDPDEEPVHGFRDIHRMLKLDQLLDNCYMQNYTIDAIADQLYISSRQLTRIVQKRYGKTLLQVIMDKRIQTAERLLVTTDMTIDKIAVAVGFSSSAGFYREFAKRYAATPAEYRRKYI